MSVAETAVGLLFIALLTWVASYVISVPKEFAPTEDGDEP